MFVFAVVIRAIYHSNQYDSSIEFIEIDFKWANSGKFNSNGVAD